MTRYGDRFTPAPSGSLARLQSILRQLIDRRPPVNTLVPHVARNSLARPAPAAKALQRSGVCAGSSCPFATMKRLVLAPLSLAACSQSQSPEQYGFIARLGRDTISVESVSRHGNTLTSDAVDRFPRVRQRHTEIVLGPDGGIQRLVMNIITPSESPDQRERHIVADVTKDSVLMVKRDKELRSAGPSRRAAARSWRTCRRCTVSTSSTSPRGYSESRRRTWRRRHCTVAAILHRSRV